MCNFTYFDILLDIDVTVYVHIVYNTSKEHFGNFYLITYYLFDESNMHSFMFAVSRELRQ